MTHAMGIWLVRQEAEFLVSVSFAQFSLSRLAAIMNKRKITVDIFAKALSLRMT